MPRLKNPTAFFKKLVVHVLRKDFRQILRRLGDSLWSDGYFYETCGSGSACKFYIERMQKKHCFCNPIYRWVIDLQRQNQRARECDL